MRRFAIGLVSCCAVVFSAESVRAQSTPATTHWAVAAASPHYGPSAAVLLGFATADLNLGIGARGGYTLPNNIYVGGTLVYQIGTSSEATFLTNTIKTSFHFLYLGPEGGYDIAAGPVLIRPYLGLGPGIASGSSSNCLQGASCAEMSNSSTNFTIWLGGTVLYPIGNFVVGGDLRALFVSDHNSIGVFATGGMIF
jgi:hypothetical protein